MYDNPQEQTQLLHHLINRVTTRASGRAEDVCLYDMPRDKYFIGNLRSAGDPDAENQSALSRELSSKIAPVAFGADFLVDPVHRTFEVDVVLKWACYYRVFPTLDEQRHYMQQPTDQQQSTESSTEPLVTDEDEERERGLDRELAQERRAAEQERQSRQRYEQRDSFCPKFRKVLCEAVGVVRVAQGQAGWQIDKLALDQAILAEFSRVQQLISQDPEALRVSSDQDRKPNITQAALESEQTYQAALNQLRTRLTLSWSWEVIVTMDDGINPRGNVLSIGFENISPMPERSANRDFYLFDVAAAFEFNVNCVLPFEIELAPDGFRYVAERNVSGRGFNCAVDQQSDTYFTTTHTPLFTQMRYSTQTNPPARFDQLAQHPIPVLEQILVAMQGYRQQWQTAEQAYQQQFGSDWSRYKSEFDEDRATFEAEIGRFERGLHLIRTNPDVALAFRLTNETFRRAGQDSNPAKQKTSWRLFQIVFLVTQIAGISALATGDAIDSAERAMVDIIYFPTGGGKTEAYLGTIVFHAFFDRLRGKMAGVTAWIRFPLRLLTLQQTQRLANIIGVAELVRREQSDPCFVNAAGFGVGYFVGSSSTPNRLTSNDQKADDRVNWSKAQSAEERNQWKRITHCPHCRTKSVQLDFDETRARLYHRCNNDSCAFPDGIIPLYIIDQETYRYLPTVIAGTVDKLAGLGNQRNFSLLFGQVAGMCSVHGYHNGTKCLQQECNDSNLLRPLPFQQDNISGPTLFLQDELHLLREGLGTFDGHYETFAQELLHLYGQDQPLKIIASSATIEEFRRQVEHLYGRERTQARVFPGSGAYLTESFYAQTRDYPQRLFLGLIPHNKTIFNAILEVIEYAHAEIQALLRLPVGSSNPYGGQIGVGSADWHALLNLYRTTLTYFLASRNLSEIHTDIDAHVNTNLAQEQYDPLELAELTGSTSTDEVAQTLEKVERTYTAGDPDTVLATSMVSHGVDVDRFNMMIFYGVPRQNAEYIQASSRVGRRHVGLVLTCLHPMRERDRSHYSYFIKYHEFLGKLVEPVAINRWSKFSIERTLPGLFMAILLQHLSNRAIAQNNNPTSYYFADTIKQKISRGEIQDTDFLDLLKQAYRVTNPTTPNETSFHDDIELRVRQFLDQIAMTQANGVFDALQPHRPMFSLRDVDESLEIELDDNGSRWANRQ